MFVRAEGLSGRKWMDGWMFVRQTEPECVYVRIRVTAHTQQTVFVLGRCDYMLIVAVMETND